MDGVFVDAGGGKEVGIKVLSKGRERRQFIQTDLGSERTEGVSEAGIFLDVLRPVTTTTNSPPWRFSGRTIPPSQRHVPLCLS